MIHYVFLDMDGVLADFIGAMCKAHGRQNPYPEKLGVDMAKAWGMSDAEFWAPTVGQDFWVNIPKLPGADDLIGRAIQRCGSANRVYVATSPSADPESLAGKKRWIGKWFPALKSRVIPIKDKWLLSAPGRMLVDDTLRHVEAWRKPADGAPGGLAVWYPGAHNAAPQENLLLI